MRFRLAFAAFFIFLLGVEARSQCTPSPQQVALFEHKNFGGRCVVRNAGSYPNPAATGLANDTLTSIRVGSAAEVVLCTNADFLGDCELYTADRADLSGTRIGNDRMSSIVVRPRGERPCLPRANEIALYLHAGFEGPCVVRAAGDYPTPLAMGIANDAVSAARVGADAQLVGCVDAQYGDHCELFTADVPDFFRTRFGNDRLSSMKVQRRGFQDCLPQPGQASFYMHGNFVGPCVTAPVGRAFENSRALGLPNDSISSVRVGSGAQICACVDDFFQGGCVAFTADDANVDAEIGNDRISSGRVTARGAPCATSPDAGVRAVEVTNCDRQKRTVFIWRREPGSTVTWTRVGEQRAQFASNGTCPAFLPFSFDLAEGRMTEVSVNTCDTQPPACEVRFAGPFRGDPRGSIVRLQIE